MHEGHRQRKREQFLKFGLAPFAEHEALELLLYYAIPRCDTNAAAHALMERFGSLDGVFSAPEQELKKVPGIGENAAVLLRLVPQICKMARLSTEGSNVILTSTEAVGQYFIRRLDGEHNEQFWMASLDQKGKVLSCRCLSEGSANRAQFSIRKVVEYTLLDNACSIIVAHNHPSGVALPSSEDRAATEGIQRALNPLGVHLMDHIIVADGDFVSFAQSGLLLILR